jgi:hypothetical protein
MSSEITAHINAVLKVSQTQDDNVRLAMRKALDMDESENKQDNAYQALTTLAQETAVALANLVVNMKRPDTGRTFRAMYDLTIGLNANLFWSKFAGNLMPLVQAVMQNHLDSVSLQLERGDDKLGPYDKLIMGAEASPLDLFSMILCLVGGPTLQVKNSVILKKELMPLLK